MAENGRVEYFFWNRFVLHYKENKCPQTPSDENHGSQQKKQNTSMLFFMDSFNNRVNAAVQET